MNFCEEQRIDLLDRGFVQDDIAAFWRYWRESGGSLTGDIQEIISKLTFCAGKTEKGAISPPYLFIGDKAYVTQCYGPNWSSGALATQGTTPDDELEELAAAGYMQAMAGEPRFDVVSVCTDSELFGGKIAIAYERLILPLETATGHRMLGCMTAPIMPTKRVSAPDSEDLWPSSTKASRPIVYA